MFTHSGAQQASAQASAQQARLPIADRRRSIVEAAIPLFARKGFDGTTTREIAQAARISEALLYRHFPSKEALHQQILDAVSATPDPVIERIRALPPSTSTLVHVLTFIVHRFVDQAAIDRDAAAQRLVLGSCIGDGEFARIIYRRIFDDAFPIFEASMIAAEAEGALVPGPISRVNRFWFAEHVASMMNAIRLSGSAAAPYHGDESDVIAEAVWFCCRGIGLTDTAIRTHFNPQVLALLSDPSAGNAPHRGSGVSA